MAQTRCLGLINYCFILYTPLSIGDHRLEQCIDNTVLTSVLLFMNNVKKIRGFKIIREIIYSAHLIISSRNTTLLQQPRKTSPMANGTVHRPIAIYSTGYRTREINNPALLHRSIQCICAMQKVSVRATRSRFSK